MNPRIPEILAECAAILRELDFIALLQNNPPNNSPNNSQDPLQNFRASLQHDLAGFEEYVTDDDLPTIQLIKKATVATLIGARNTLLKNSKSVTDPMTQRIIYVKFRELHAQIKQSENKELRHFLLTIRSALYNANMIPRSVTYKQSLAKSIADYEAKRKNAPAQRRSFTYAYFALQSRQHSHTKITLQSEINKIARLHGALVGPVLEMFRLTQKLSLQSVALVPHVSLRDFNIA